MAVGIRLSFLATVLVLIYCIHEGLSIKCYVCRSDNDPKCTDPFDNTTYHMTNCAEEKDLAHLPGVRPTMCRKIRQKVHGEWKYYRSCAFMGEPGIGGDERFCLMRTGTYNIFMEYCTCNSKDGCNLAPYQHENWLLLLIGLATAVRYMFVI